MSEKEETAKVFIYCDDPSHRKTVAVTNFWRINPPGSDQRSAGRWNERYTSPAAQGTRESGTTLIGDRLPERGEIRPGAQLDGVRSRYTILCRKCKHRPVSAREDSLFAVLNAFAEAGVSSVSLTVLAASLQRIDA